MKRWIAIAVVCLGARAGFLDLSRRAERRSKEAVLKNNLFVLRTVIQEYRRDKQKAPQLLADLVNEGYLRTIPGDPVTGSAETWLVKKGPAIVDIHSGAGGRSLDGPLYADW